VIGCALESQVEAAYRTRRPAAPRMRRSRQEGLTQDPRTRAPCSIALERFVGRNPIGLTMLEATEVAAQLEEPVARERD
jgi:hypothetical protein